MKTTRLQSMAVAGLVVTFLFVHLSRCLAEDALRTGFQHPPDSARAWVYWFPLDGNISSNGITADLEAMKRAGIGGVLYMETSQGTPPGPAKFAGPLWRNLFKHICAEASRLGIQVNMNNDAGWCGSGGPWITPELSMQRLVSAETNVTGPTHFEGVLPQPTRVANFYEDIVVFAFPTPASNYVIPHFRGKAAETKEEIPLTAQFPQLPSDAVIARGRIVDITAKLGSDGRLTWEVPEGKWTVMRIGHTSTGKDNHPAPMDGRGLESDKLSKRATEAHFAGLMEKLIADSKPLVGTKKTLVSTHIDSWETGSQNWTPKFRADFKRLRGYDPMPLLPVMRGHVVDSLEISERFLWDIRMTVNDLLMENYARHMRALARKNDIRLSIEAYDGSPTDDLTYGGTADEPMGEFWSWAKFGAAYSCTEMASAAHTYGKPIVGAEAFTATDAEKWAGHPARVKDLGDWAFCEGINRFVFHRYALQPWTHPDRAPGISMGPWGLHYERTQTWWEQSRAWHEYLARCQFMLQQGLFVADLCFLVPERSPQQFKSPVKSGYDRPPYNFDGCSPEVVLTRMKVKNGRLTLPDGMSYNVLVLPHTETMTPRLLRKVRDLVGDGATVVGAPPMKSPSLSGFPKCDAEIKELAAELWGAGPAPAELTGHPYRKGRVFWGGPFRPKEVVASEGANLFGQAKWIWRAEGNPAVAAPAAARFFRRAVVIDANSRIATARLTLTADNSFECWVNGRVAGSGDSFKRAYSMAVDSLLKPGTNVIAVRAVNATENPNPAGLIGCLSVRLSNGTPIEVPTDATWESAAEASGAWNTDLAASSAWKPVKELGPIGMAPWGDIETTLGGSDPIPDANVLCDLFAKLEVPPDFTSQTSGGSQAVRYIHKKIGADDVYFVANKTQKPLEAICSFRVAGKRPELWRPDTGRIESIATYSAAGAITRLPIAFEPSGSVFVVFRDAAEAAGNQLVSITHNGAALLDLESKEFPAPAGKEAPQPVELTRDTAGNLVACAWQGGDYTCKSANGESREFAVMTIPAPFEITGAWDVRFAPGWGAPEQARFEKLISWSDHSDAGVKYFSGTAAYTKNFTMPSDLVRPDRRLVLDLGGVAVMAEVKLNGKDLGILWKPPFRVDVTEACKAGENRLEVKVVNLWINRMIGDEQLPEDSDRHSNGTLKEWPKWLEDGKPSPAGRYTFTSWRLWKKNSPLQESGLLGPVRIESAEIRVLK